MRKAIVLSCVGMVLIATSGAATNEAVVLDQLYRPALFKRFGEHVNVPDGLAQDEQGNIYCAAPNFVNKSYPGTIMKMNGATGEWSVFVPGLIHPDTGRGAPMGMEFGEDGHLYYCDNQYFFDKNYKSRIMRVIIGANGEPSRIEPVVENIKLANAMRTRGNAIYFTETFFDIKGRNFGGVYRIPISAFKHQPVQLLPKEQWKQDPYCIGVTETEPLSHRNDAAAADGLCFDKDGNIYTGNFGDGHLYTMRLRHDGTYEKPETLINDPQRLPCADGICYYPEREWIIITDSERNAVLYWDIRKEELGTLWMNGDTDGGDGLLDQPCEPMVWKNKLLVVNFDMSFPGLLNTENDDVHTISVIQLEKSWLPFLNLFR
ncbi:MAG: hypothetical protein R6V06_01540 [Kiritimatiellia bacterium]